RPSRRAISASATPPTTSRPGGASKEPMTVHTPFLRVAVKGRSRFEPLHKLGSRQPRRCERQWLHSGRSHYQEHRSVVAPAVRRERLVGASQLREGATRVASSDLRRGLTDRA